MTSDGKETKKLYYEDSHLKEFTATVLSCEERLTAKGKKDGYAVVLDQTAFFPEGGGQSGDRGWLDEAEVYDTHEKNGLILHYTRTPLEEGKTVTGKLDFAERFSRMQEHSGEHIVSGIVHRLHGYDNVGFHLGSENTTLDFNGELTEEDLLEVERLANEAVFADLPVQVSYPSREELEKIDYRSKIEIEGQVRLVGIPGVDLCACCAPHVNHTGEIGMIKLISCDRHRGGCRVTMLSGIRALKDYQQKQAQVTAVSVELSAKPEKIGEAVQRLKEQQETTRFQLNRMQAVYLEQKLGGISAEDKVAFLFEEELDSIAVRNFVNGAVERFDGICAAFVGTDEKGYRYILGSRAKDVRKLAKELNSHFTGKGGGKPEMVQGSLTGKEAEIRAVIRDFLSTPLDKACLSI